MAISKMSIGQLSIHQVFLKRLVDFILAFICLSLTWPIIAISWLLATVDTRSNGFFFQRRVGKNGQIFYIVKIKTMKPLEGKTTSITTRNDPRITKLGAIFRELKIDELPQLWNVLWGDMSFVGPRPDVPGYADCLIGKSREILLIRPGITGPASLKYRDEEVLLSIHEDPEAFNREVIWPDKVRINQAYIRDWSLLGDFKYILLSLTKR